MLLHPRPRRVLAVGALASGLLPELLRHPVERLDVVESDPALPGLLRRWLPREVGAALADPRVRVHATDLRRALARGGLYDLVLLADPDPATLRLNRTRSLETLAAVASGLAPGGLVVVRVGAGDTYLGGAGGRLVGVLAATLRTALPALRAVPGEEILLVAAREAATVSLDPMELETRAREAGLAEPGLPVEMVRVLLDPTRAAALDAFVRESPGAANRDDLPRAVLPALALAEARGAGALLPAILAADRVSRAWGLSALAVLCLLVLLRGALGHGPRAEVAAVTGGASMAWWVLLLAAWQRSRGAVYAEVGALSAAFMAGLVGGAVLARRWGGLEVRVLPWLSLSGAALSAGIAVGLPHTLGVVVVPLLLLLAGGLTGAAFPGLAVLAGAERTREGAGRGFAFEEAGAAAAALLVGVLLLPSAGVAGIAWGVAALQCSVAVALGVSGWRRGHGAPPAACGAPRGRRRDARPCS